MDRRFVTPIVTVRYVVQDWCAVSARATVESDARDSGNVTVKSELLVHRADMTSVHFLNTSRA